MREADDPVQSDHVDGNFSWNQLEVAHPLSPENTVKFSTYSDPLEWVILLEDRTTTESLNQSQGACRSIDHRIWLATVSHYVRGLQQGTRKHVKVTNISSKFCSSWMRFISAVKDILDFSKRVILVKVNLVM